MREFSQTRQERHAWLTRLQIKWKAKRESESTEEATSGSWRRDPKSPFFWSCCCKPAFTAVDWLCSWFVLDSPSSSLTLFVKCPPLPHTYQSVVVSFMTRWRSSWQEDPDAPFQVFMLLILHAFLPFDFFSWLRFRRSQELNQKVMHLKDEENISCRRRLTGISWMCSWKTLRSSCRFYSRLPFLTDSSCSSSFDSHKDVNHCCSDLVSNCVCFLRNESERDALHLRFRDAIVTVSLSLFLKSSFCVRYAATVVAKLLSKVPSFLLRIMTTGLLHRLLCRKRIKCMTWHTEEESCASGDISSFKRILQEHTVSWLYSFACSISYT